MSRTTTFILIGTVAFFLFGAMALAALFVGRRYLQIDDQNAGLETPLVIAAETAVPTIQATTTVSGTETVVPTQTAVPVTGTAVPATTISVNATTVQYILTQTDVNIRSGPGTNYDVVGWVKAGQTAAVTGVSSDNGWWRVVCPNGTSGSCWMTARAQYTQPTAGQNSAPTATPGTTACTDSASLIADVTIPDGTQLAPNTGFNKTWRIKNIGTCTWDHRYKLVLAGGHAMGAVSTGFPLPDGIVPGQTVDLTVSLVSPATPDSYQGDWKLQNPQAQAFGVGRSSSPFWVKIVVTGGATATISGYVYQDANQNGIYDSGEILMGSREVWLMPGTACQVKQNAIEVAFSGADGRYTFKGNYAGSYCVGLSGENGLADVASVSIATGQVLTNIDLRAPVAGGSITGFIWNDYCLTNENGDALDGNCVTDAIGDYHADGMIQPTETYIAGVTVFLQFGSCSNNSAVPVAAVTDASGKY
ncbi:MAG: SH3 domain-containing protein, partial [Anaerolineales bacterium]|nr:SH3 domain-containing protein [Anaerolineales bacterium]